MITGQSLDSYGLFTEYRKKIYNYIYRLVQDRAEAEDLTQETLVRAYHNLMNLQDKSKLSAWITSDNLLIITPPKPPT